MEEDEKGGVQTRQRPSRIDAERADEQPRRKDDDHRTRRSDQDELQHDGKSDQRDNPDHDDQAGSDGDGQQEKPPKRRVLPFIIAGVVLALLVVGGVFYWLDARHYESTDDAFVDGHVSQVAPRVAGQVLRLMVEDNQPVAAGQLLVEIDPRDYQVRLDQTRAQLANARAQLAQSQANVDVQQAAIEQAESQVRVAEADLSKAQTDLNRYRAVNPAAISRQQLDTSDTTTRSSRARVDSARQGVTSARAQLEAAQAQVQAAQASVQTAQTEVANAELQLSYTRITAPQAGRVTRRTVEVGNYLNPGTALMSIVPDALWVTANFKETQLADMKPGQKVAISVDASPAHDLPAHIDSFQSGSGSYFSTLPAENATGNYIKVVQRVPVKIVFDGDDWRQARLAPGLSVVPRVTVR